MPNDWNTTIMCLFTPNTRSWNAAIIGHLFLNVTYKMFNNILAVYIEPCTEKFFGEYQSGFLTDRSRTDHIFTIRMLYQTFYESNKHFDTKNSIGSDNGIPVLL